MLEIKEQFNAVLRLLDREDQLTNSRMTWYLTIQGFIIAGVALTFAEHFKPAAIQKPAIILLSSLGIAISVVIFISVRRARNAKNEIKKKWENWLWHQPSSIANSFPNPAGDTSRWSHLTPGQSVPLILIVFWLVVIMKAGKSVPFVMGWIAAIITLILIRFFGKYLSKQSVGRFDNIRGVVYDLDGTIIDSSHVHVEAWRAAGIKYGIEITPTFLEFQKGKTNEEAAENLLNPLGKIEILQDFVTEKIAYANEHAEEVLYFEDFTLAYKQLCQRGTSVWVCTSSPKEFCIKVYEKFSHLKTLSDRTVWREEYHNGKDEGLQLTFKKMKVEPQNGIYVGDAPSDWKAAQEIGCHFVGYRTSTIKCHCELLSLLS